jgi:type 1 fimbria pilin
LKRLIAIAALLLGTAAAFAVPASASTACLSVHVDINGTVIDQNPCV